ncbi:ImmA/IrrE family metallo-endopeptidase [Salibacterium aidingense]|uniref:ImmA/IrrE family metallo-endopeptidase n=1 Tax=Salibacterium aidingense TaxID=384933 RepID=UPI003BC273E4
MSVYTHLEDFIYDLYHQHIKIYHPKNLDMHEIAYRLNIPIEYSHNINLFYRGVAIIKPSTPQQEWQNFGHELCHILRHAGNQKGLPNSFLEMQEWQAENFSKHFCIPTFMLEKLRLPKMVGQAVQCISDLFNVEPEFARSRLEQFREKITFQEFELYSHLPKHSKS